MAAASENKPKCSSCGHKNIKTKEENLITFEESQIGKDLQRDTLASTANF